MVLVCECVYVEFTVIRVFIGNIVKQRVADVTVFFAIPYAHTDRQKCKHSNEERKKTKRKERNQQTKHREIPTN